ncbi:hypothetical protein, partial [Nocardia carnea]|uniref:hypothetical protein n=1 Tax=Nocardia carnea TaxID=37328 RepID=UPI0024579289
MRSPAGPGVVARLEEAAEPRGHLGRTRWVPSFRAAPHGVGQGSAVRHAVVVRHAGVVPPVVVGHAGVVRPVVVG